MYIQDLVSIIIPTYKRSDTLTRAVDSVLMQTYQNIEVLVVDDNERGSAENKAVEELMARYIDHEKVFYITQQKHVNGAVARNVGINRAMGEYIAFLDDDDQWDEKKLEKQVKFLKQNSDIDGVSTLYQMMRGSQIIRTCDEYTCENMHKKVISRDVAVFTSTLLLRKAKLDKSGHFCETLQRHQDLQLLLDFLYENNMEVIPECLVTLHADSNINRPNSAKLIEIKKQFFDVCEKHLHLYNKKEQKQIMAAHYFEIMFLALKERKVFTLIKYVFKIGFDVKAYNDALTKWKKR